MKKSLFSTLILISCAGSLFGQMTVTLTATSTQVSVGTPIGWNTQVDGVDPDGSAPPPIWYRYRVRLIGEDYAMVSDFGPNQNLQWAPSAREGTYEMEVTAMNVTTGEEAVQNAVFHVMPLATSAPVVTPTSHPLVFLYSAPGCTGGSRMRLAIQDPSGNLQTTPYKACRGGVTTNFYVAGMQPNTAYQVHHTIDTGSAFVDGPGMNVTTGSLPQSFASYSVLKAPPATTQDVLLQSTLFEPTVATDLNGNILWYYPSGDVSFLTRPESGGRFLGVYEDSTKDKAHQVLREFDLVGNTIQQTNAARVNQQLQAMNKRQINSFHHEALRLPDGSIMTLGAVEQILTDVQGPGPVDVIGDMIIVLDKNLQVVWTWDAFDHLDPTRMATLNETCTATTGGCPPVYLAPKANDWLHGNALQLTPDGNILYSMRHQDWIAKIDYSNGAGSGNIIWRLGLGGDFTINSSDPYPWFSHQHNPNIETADTSLLDVFDNGNVRYAQDGSAHSRGQVYKLDEQNRVATPILNADLGAYALAVGSAQRLADDNYHFDLGFINTAQGQFSQSVEFDAFGNLLYKIQTPTPAYRTFRLKSLYAQ
jgi:hypothetical protein